LDIVRALKERGIDKIKLTSRIRPASISQEKYILERGLDLGKPLKDAVTVFEGTAEDAAVAFPRHFNVAIALSLAGVGFRRTDVHVIADPAVDGPIHHIDAVGQDASLTLESRNRSSVNPRTARLVAPSLLAAIRSYVDPIRVGT
jgi:aspartate dehydrogenase